LDFAPHGQLIEWDEEESKFYYNNPETVGFLSEEVLKKIFRQCITGVHYCNTCLLHKILIRIKKSTCESYYSSRY